MSPRPQATRSAPRPGRSRIGGFAPSSALAQRGQPRSRSPASVYVMGLRCLPAPRRWADGERDSEGGMAEGGRMHRGSPRSGPSMTRRSPRDSRKDANHQDWPPDTITAAVIGTWLSAGSPMHLTQLFDQDFVPPSQSSAELPPNRSLRSLPPPHTHKRCLRRGAQGSGMPPPPPTRDKPEQTHPRRCQPGCRLVRRSRRGGARARPAPRRAARRRRDAAHVRDPPAHTQP
jgi:hypothetical protein